MPTTVVFDLVDRLVEVFAESLPSSITVYDGYSLSEDDGDFLMVGVTDPNDLDSMDSVEAKQEWAGLGNRTRYESGFVRCVALTRDGDTDLRAARAACKAIVAAAEEVLREDPSLGGEVDGLQWTGFGNNRVQLIQDQNEEGALALLVFEIHFQARI